MSRSERLFDLLQILRRHRGTVSGRVLAEEAGVSLRTIRRDIATLQSLGADIDAQAGVGYVLRPGFLLPPLAFTTEEIQALMLGAEWVSRQADAALTAAIRNAVAKIDGVMSPATRHGLDDATFYVAAPRRSPTAGLDLGQCRRAVRDQLKMRIAWREDDGSVSMRIVWPILLGFDGAERSFAAWCERDQCFQRFDEARIAEAEILAERYPGQRSRMVKEWRVLAVTLCSQRLHP